MLGLIAQAILPIVVVLGLGYSAGWKERFTAAEASVLNRMVLAYAFPMSLFVGIAGTKRSLLLAQWPLAVAVFAGMVGVYIVGLVVLLFVLRQPLTSATLRAFSWGGSAAPFMGGALLFPLVERPSATVAIASAGFAMTLIQSPISIVLLMRGIGHEGGPWWRQLIEPAKEPMVWAPVLAILVVVAGIHFPAPILAAFNLLGGATAGVALFASGIVMYSQRVGFSWPIFVNVLMRNLIVPFTMWAILLLLGVSETLLRTTVLTMSIPIGSVVILLAIRFGTDEHEAASSLFISTIASVLTMALFIGLLG